MSNVDRNIDVIRRLEDAYAARDYETVRGLLAPDITPHTPGADLLPSGLDGPVASNEASFAMFPDRRVRIEDLFGEGDRTVAHVRLTGTNTGAPVSFAGLTEATGKAVDFDWIQIARHDDQGRVAETWSQIDVPTMLVQLGAMPAPGGM